jgi:hypothetical protein
MTRLRSAWLAVERSQEKGMPQLRRDDGHRLRRAHGRQLDFPRYGGCGLTDEFTSATWSRIRDEIYREQGA